MHKLAQWVPHALTDFDHQRRAEVATALLSYRRTDNWLDSITTADEKWCLYVNIKRKRHWVGKDEQPDEHQGDELNIKWKRHWVGKDADLPDLKT